jgi:Mrp family chromosome partitioning ATPase/capsular polysaccharide biosynthesis protein
LEIQETRLDVRQYLGVARRHLVLILACTLAVAGAAYAYSAHKTPYYESSVQILYTPQFDYSDPLGTTYVDPTTQELEIENAAALVTGPTIRARMVALAGKAAGYDYSVSAAVTNTASGASVSTDNGIAVTVDSTAPRLSATLANAYASALVGYSLDDEKTRLNAAIAVVTAQLKTLPRTSPDYSTLASDLQNDEVLLATATGDFTVAAPASPSFVPVSPRTKRTAEMGLVLGLALGIAVAFLRERLDTAVRSSQEVAEITGLPVIGRIGKIPAAVLAAGPLVVTEAGDVRTVEAIRVLRSNLQFAALGEQNRVMSLMSAQRGEGKSLLTANLAAALALAGKNVAVIDADLRQPRLHAIFAVPNTGGVSSVVAGLSSLDAALQTYQVSPTVHVADQAQPARDATGSAAPPVLTLLTAGPLPPNPGEIVASPRFQGLVAEVAGRGFDYVFVDAPALLAVGDATAIAPVVDGVVLLANLKVTDRPTLEEVCEHLSHLPCKKLGVVTVMEPREQAASSYHSYARGPRADLAEERRHVMTADRGRGSV